MEDGNISYPESGSPQGGCISPILANIYLHYVLDMRFEETVKPQLPGSAKLIRFADDFVIVFSNRDAALQVKEMLAERFAEYGLTVHPEKTRLVDFRHPLNSDRKRDGQSKPDTFDLLGFTHYWGKSRKGNSRGEEENDVETVDSIGSVDLPMVSQIPAFAGTRAVAEVVSEGPRPLRLLWRNRKRSNAEQFSPRGA